MDSTNFYTIVHADGALGVFIYSYLVSTLAGVKSGKIA